MTDFYNVYDYYNQLQQAEGPASPAVRAAFVNLYNLAQNESRRGNGDAQQWLGGVLYHGHDFMPADRARGLELLQTAAAQGHVQAMIDTAEIYCGPEMQKYDLALQLFSKAASMGDIYAACRRAEMIYLGQGRTPSKDEAAAILIQHIGQGCAYACLTYGRLLLDDTTVAGHQRKAALLFQQGLDIFNPDIDAPQTLAQLDFMMGYCLFYGLGVTGNIPRALNLILTASRLGAQEAGDWLTQYGPTIDQPPQRALDHILNASGDKNGIIPAAPDQDIAAATGWAQPKRAYAHIAALARHYLADDDKNLPAAPLSFILAGDSGTGKKYFAQLLGAKLKQSGYLSSGHIVTADMTDIMTRGQRSMMMDVSQMGGMQSQELFKSLFVDTAERAQGGILIIRDFRTDFGENYADAILEQRAIAEIEDLAARQNDHPDKRFVILFMQEGRDSATIDRLFKKNHDLARRPRMRVLFDNFTADDITAIIEQRLQTHRYTITDDARQTLRAEIIRRLSAAAPEHINLALADTLLFEMIGLRAQDGDGLARHIDTAHIPVARTRDDYDLAEILAPLNALPGMDAIKEEITNICQFLRQRQLRAAAGEETGPLPTLHFVFTGPPGTGKTTVARLLGEILHKIGYLERGHLIETDGTSMLGKYMGQTPAIVREKVDLADGGVLFVDEAYTLGQRIDGGFKDMFREEAIASLLKLMEDRRGRFVVIAAGYDAEMQQFIDANSGLKSRFTRFIPFAGFTAATLLQIFGRMATESGYTVTDDARDKINTFLSGLRTTAQINAFGNARGVRSLFEKTIAQQSSRIITAQITGADARAITADDIILHTPPRIAARDAAAIKDLLAPLDELIGLDDVKNKIGNLVYLTQAQMIRSERGLPRVPVMLHSIFSGPSGTGKTTVARLMGRILADLGYLSSGHVVEVAKGGLTGQYMGETPRIVEQKVNLARGGILFIDEAYALADNAHGNEYGYEALVTLLKLMEDRRDEFIVIAAGYKKEMDKFLAANSGLQSRFPFAMDFRAYTAAEITAIFVNFAREAAFTVTPQAQEKITNHIAQLSTEQRDRHGHGRLARNIFEATIGTQSRRVISQNLLDERMTVIEEADITFPRDNESERPIGFQFPRG